MRNILKLFISLLERDSMINIDLLGGDSKIDLTYPESKKKDI